MAMLQRFIAGYAKVSQRTPGSAVPKLVLNDRAVLYWRAFGAPKNH
jgi:hypothetical protein